MNKTAIKRFTALVLLITILLCPSSLSVSDNTVYADVLDDKMDEGMLYITQKAFGDKVKAEIPESKSFSGRLYESSRNTLKSIGVGKGVPKAAEYIGKGADLMKQKTLSTIKAIGESGMNRHAKYALNAPRTTHRKGRMTQKYLKHLNAKNWYGKFKKLADIKIDPGKLGNRLDRAGSAAAGIYGFYSMWDNPDIGYKSPTLEFYGNAVRGIANTAAIAYTFTPEGWKEAIGLMADGFMIGDIVMNSPIVVDLVNSTGDILRDADEGLGAFKYVTPLHYLLALADINDYVVDSANLTLQEGFGNAIDWWNYWVNGVEGDENEKLLEEMQKKCKGATFQGNGVGVYKPNIYLYPAASADVSVEFALPETLTVTDPPYENSWYAFAEPDGTLTVDGQNYGYLFYESLTDPLDYQTSEGFVIPADSREEMFTEILTAYGLNDSEITDFNDFWCEKLDEGCDYAMYPQTSEVLNVTMPMTVTPAPDSIGRVWFAFEKNAVPEKHASIQPFEREGFTVIEWGGFFLRERAET